MSYKSLAAEPLPELSRDLCLTRPAVLVNPQLRILALGLLQYFVTLVRKSAALDQLSMNWGQRYRCSTTLLVAGVTWCLVFPPVFSSSWMPRGGIETGTPMAQVPWANSPPDCAHTTERQAGQLPYRLLVSTVTPCTETSTSPEEASVTLSTSSPRRTVNRTPSWAGSLRIEAISGAPALTGSITAAN